MKTPSRRTRIVWGVFLGAMTAVTGLMLLNDRDGLPRPNAGFLLTNVQVLGNRSPGDSALKTAAPLDRQRWTGIVIHHLNEPAGDADSVSRKHLSMGYSGLGYHFLIGNGNGLGDGVVHVGYRWLDQLPGAHVIGTTRLAAEHNQQSIAICLIGNGDRRGFTDRQIAQLANLVQRLQAELKIPSRNVYLHRDLVPETSSPGKFFPTAQFREQLLD